MVILMQLLKGKEVMFYLEVFKKLLLKKMTMNLESIKIGLLITLKETFGLVKNLPICSGRKDLYNDELTDHHKNIAAALQLRLETVVLNQLRRAREEFKFNKLCIAGGVGLNCSLNGKIESSGIFDEIFVQPASGDDGVTFGACLLAYKNHKGSLMPKKMHIL